MTERKKFPDGGSTWDTLKSEMDSLRAGDIDWKNGRAPLYVFYNDAETLEIGKRAFNEYFSENALGRKRAFMSIQKMEKDVLDFGLSLFSASASGHGVFTSGGSESILLAKKAARDLWRHAHDGDTGPLNLVMPISAHPAFDKACNLMDITIRRVPLREDCRVDVSELAELVDDRTMAIVGSAPCFPHGIIDDISALSDLAESKGLWLHVDACVGGWVAPFFAQNGRSTPDFDFRFAGVRSISADLHKFGFCPKPASTVFFRNAADHEAAVFISDAWPNGRFETPTLVGTRPGGSVASAWAVLRHLGTSGYRDVALRLAAVIDRYVTDIESIEGLRMVTRPDLTIISFTSDDVDMALVADGMKARGWLPGMTQNAKGLHIMMSMFHGPAREDYISDLKEAVQEARDKVGAAAESAAVY